MAPTTDRASHTPNLRWSSLRHELLWIWDGRVEETALDTVADHRHGYWVWLLREGEVTVTMDGKSWKAVPGQWLVCPHGSAAQHFSPGARILSLHFECDWPTGENLFLEKEGAVFAAADFPDLEARAMELEGLVSQRYPGVRVEYLMQETAYDDFLEIQVKFLQLLMAFYRAMVAQGRTLFRGGGGDERLWRAIEFLHKAPLDKPFPVDELQRSAALGKLQLNRLFREEFNMTMREYWENLRLDSARASLESTSVPVKEIAYSLDFKQPSHFTRWFSRRMGRTPQQYREQILASPHFTSRAHDEPDAA